ncbi:unnamed protein product [Moneuplotes crassus]|uniref:Uncharacterized protein n=1 Tax=Euplotes crassus TaxID=5936 RepID=A0AAD1XNC6_EUPCR|nr:unnamed protein product [Moneuplotes crassus]
MAAKSTSSLIASVLNGTISNIKDSAFLITSNSKVSNAYMISQILKSKLHKKCIIIKFLKDSLPKKLVEQAEEVQTDNFTAKKLTEKSFIIECIPTLSLGNKNNFESLKRMFQNGDSFDSIFTELGLSDHASLVIDSLNILTKIIGLKELDRIKFIPNLMPVYFFQNPKLVNEKVMKKYSKFFDVNLRLESTNLDEDKLQDVFYIGIKKSHARFEEKKYLLETTLSSLITTITEYKEPEAEEEKKEDLPQSTFSLKSQNNAESQARDNVELPYFVGENEDNGDKSNLFTVDDEDKIEEEEDPEYDVEEEY